VGGVMVESAAYNPNRRAEWMFPGHEACVEARHQHGEVEEDKPCIPYHPYGYFFLREMKLEEHRVPCMRANHLPELSIPGFWHLFGGLSQTEVIAKFTRSGMIPPVADMPMRTTNKRPTPIYVNEREDDEVLFHLSAAGHLLASINNDTGSDLEDNDPLPPEQDTCNIDMFLTNLFRQMVIDIKCKTPNPKGMVTLSYSRLNQDDRNSPDEAPFQTLQLDTVFTAVWYTQAGYEWWQMAFNWLLPPPNTRVSAQVQNYSSCQYYKTWHHILEANRENPRVIEAIREAFWKRVRTWSWMPMAQADKMWATFTQNAQKRGFRRLPVNGEQGLALFILIHSHGMPIFIGAA